MLGAAASPFFMNPLVAVLPRLLFPVAVWGIFTLLNFIPHMPKIISVAFSAALGTFIHTVLVMGAIFIFYGNIFLPMVLGAIEKSESAQKIFPDSRRLRRLLQQR